MPDYDLKWTQTSYRLTGKNIVGNLSNYTDAWIGKLTVFTNSPDGSPDVKEFRARVGSKSSPDAIMKELASKAGVPASSLSKILAKDEAIGLAEFRATIQQTGPADSLKNALYTAIVFPTYFLPHVELTDKPVSYDECKDRVEKAYEVYRKAMGAILKAAGNVEKAYKGGPIEENALERIIQGAADAGFRV